MQLVQIGTKLINLDHVSSIVLDGEAVNWGKRQGPRDYRARTESAVVIMFDHIDDSLELFGFEAEAFRAWVSQTQTIERIPVAPARGEEYA